MKQKISWAQVLLYDRGMRSDVEVRLGPGDRERLEKPFWPIT